MKALEILKENKEQMIKFINCFDDDCKEDDEYLSACKYINQIDEAIKELEELENRSCENCKTISKCSILRKVIKDRLRKDGYLMSQKEFDCRFWEPKK
jgi:ribonuclease HII